MTIDDQFKDEKYNVISKEKLQKYQPHFQVKLISMNISQVKK